MATTGVNLAVTKDGETYNKLQRPDDYLTSTTPLLPPLPAATRPELHPAKRKRDRDCAPPDKRARGHNSFAKIAREGPVRECGTPSRLPGVDDDDPLSDSSIGEALAYLRSVRSEASSIPQVLVAPIRETDRSDEDQQKSNSNTLVAQQSIYDDGASMAIDDEGVATYDVDGWDEDDSNLDSQKSCYVLLLRQFQTLRRKLRDHKVGKLSRTADLSEENSRITQHPKKKQDWLRTFSREYPILEHVCQMNEQTLFHGLECCATYLAQACTVSHQTSCWAWTLLALIGDVGTLDNERISKVRSLGSQAGRLAVRCRDVITSSQYHGDGRAGEQGFGFRKEKISHHDVQRVAGNSDNRKPDEAADVSPDESHDGKVIADHDRHGSAHAERKKQDLGRDMGESDTDMSTSVSGEQDPIEMETLDLEQARARLLAQLGDRLVQSVAPSQADTEKKPEQTRGEEPQKPNNQQGTTVPVQHCPCEFGLEEQVNMSDWNTRATIDMILTVVAECYGQRDLLEFREAW